MEEQFNQYQDAFDSGLNLHNELRKQEEAAIFLKHKATRRDRFAIITFVVGVIGLLVTVIGVFV